MLNFNENKATLNHTLNILPLCQTLMKKYRPNISRYLSRFTVPVQYRYLQEFFIKIKRKKIFVNKILFRERSESTGM
jgi:hypothetical protein